MMMMIFWREICRRIRRFNRRIVVVWHYAELASLIISSAAEYIIRLASITQDIDWIFKIVVEEELYEHWELIRCYVRSDISSTPRRVLISSISFAIVFGTVW